MTLKHYISRVKGHITAIRCKGCSTNIQGLVPHSGTDTVVRRAGNTVIRETLVHMAPNNHYREFGIVLRLPNNRMQCHVTHCCEKCLRLVSGPMGADMAKLLRLWYEEDLFDQFKKTDGPKMPKKFYDWLMSGQVVGVDLDAGVNLSKTDKENA